MILSLVAKKLKMRVEEGVWHQWVITKNEVEPLRFSLPLWQLLDDVIITSVIVCVDVSMYVKSFL